MKTASEKIRSDGWCLFPGVLPRLDDLEDDLQDRIPEQVTPFSNTALDWRTEYLGLYMHPAVRSVLAELECPDPKFFSAYFVNKHWGEAREPWHHNWYAWNEPTSRNRLGPQLGLMVFLDQTDAVNGALEVVPGSHRNWWADHFKEHKDWFDPHPRGVPVYAGHSDIVVVDARTLHSFRPNNSRKSRKMVTMWFFTDWRSMTPEFRALQALRSFRDEPDKGEEEVRMAALGDLWPRSDLPYNPSYATRDYPMPEDLIIAPPSASVSPV